MAAQPGIVIADNINIRSGPSNETDIIGQASVNERVTILLYDENFYMVNIGTHSNVFISREFIEHAEPEEHSVYAIAGSTNANIRASNSTTSEILGVTNEGDRFLVHASIDGWLRITYDSQTAYIYGGFLTLTASLDTLPATVLSELPEDEYDIEESEYIPEEPGVNAMPSDFAALLASVLDIAESTENVTAEAVHIDPNRTFNPHSNIHAVVSSSTGLNLRTNPTTESESVIILHPMQSLNVYDIFSDWARVSTMDGRNTGYVNVEFITIRTGSRQAPPAPNPEKAQDVIYFARMFIGTPYLFGGTDLQSGVDCSGFIFSVFSEFGVSLGRSSRDMINNGIPIEREDIAPGDLLFFSANGTVVTHVALYMGNDQFIHSTDTRGLGVSFASLSSDHSRRTFFGARRVIQ